MERIKSALSAMTKLQLIDLSERLDIAIVTEDEIKIDKLRRFIKKTLTKTVVLSYLHPVSIDDCDDMDLDDLLDLSFELGIEFRSDFIDIYTLKRLIRDGEATGYRDFSNKIKDKNQDDFDQLLNQIPDSEVCVMANKMKIMIMDHATVDMKGLKAMIKDKLIDRAFEIIMNPVLLDGIDNYPIEVLASMCRSFGIKYDFVEVDRLRAILRRRFEGNR